MKVQGNPKVSVIILNKDHREDLEKCVVSIEEKTDYPNYEIIVVENNSELPETFAFYEELQRRYSNVKVVTWDGPFNYSAINNYGAEYATGDYYLMLNNDIEVISPGWMSEMLGYCQREDVGIVGGEALLFRRHRTARGSGRGCGRLCRTCSDQISKGRDRIFRKVGDDSGYQRSDGCLPDD